MKLKLILYLYFLKIVHARFVKRLFGASEVIPHDFPNMVAIYAVGRYLDQNHPFQFCGGVIYNSWWVATAGTCIVNIDIMFPMENVVVMAGKWEFGRDENFQQLRGVQNMVEHERFDPLEIGISVDLGLLHLDQELIFDDLYVYAIPFSSIVTYPSGEIIMLGWGCTTEADEEAQRVTSVLRFREDTIVNFESCRFAIKRILMSRGIDIRSNYFEDYHFCTGTFREERLGPSYGDSGGPVLQRNQTNQYEVIGLISLGVKNRNLGLHTAVAPFIEWIENAIRDHSRS